MSDEPNQTLPKVAADGDLKIEIAEALKLCRDEYWKAINGIPAMTSAELERETNVRFEKILARLNRESPPQVLRDEDLIRATIGLFDRILGFLIRRFDLSADSEVYHLAGFIEEQMRDLRRSQVETHYASHLQTVGESGEGAK